MSCNAGRYETDSVICAERPKMSSWKVPTNKELAKSRILGGEIAADKQELATAKGGSAGFPGLSLDGFMQSHDFDGVVDGRSTHKYANPKDWSNSDVALVRKALPANAFAQVIGLLLFHQSQTGAIVGIIKEMKVQMEGELK